MLARHAPPTTPELLKMVEAIGLDEELLQDFIDGVDGDLQQVATMLTDQGAPPLATVRAQSQKEKKEEQQDVKSAGKSVRGPSCRIDQLFGDLNLLCGR